MKIPFIARVLFGVSSLPLIGASDGLLAATVSATDPLVQVEGRTAVVSEGVRRVGFPGVAFRLKVETASLAMRCRASNANLYIDVEVDGGEAQRLKLAAGEQTLPVFTGAAGLHDVVVTRRNESWQGTIEVLGFDAAEGRFLAPVPQPERRLLFIGDSVTCGEATDIRAGDPADGPHTACGRLAYGKVLARKLGAQCHLVSYGGRGIIRDWQGIRDTANAPVFYERALPDEATPLWDHASYVPDGIGIALGTNDFNQGVPDENEFVNAYVELVRKVRRDAPNAFIVLIDSPIVNDSPDKGPRQTVLRHYLDEVVRRVGSPRVVHVRGGHYPGRPENAHPIAHEHVAIAGELEPVFRAGLSW